MPGGGVSAGNAAEIAARIPQIREIHASCSRPLPTPGDARIATFGFQPEGARGTDAALVRGLRLALDQISARPMG